MTHQWCPLDSGWEWFQTYRIDDQPGIVAIRLGREGRSVYVGVAEEFVANVDFDLWRVVKVVAEQAWTEHAA